MHPHNHKQNNLHIMICACIYPYKDSFIYTPSPSVFGSDDSAAKSAADVLLYVHIGQRKCPCLQCW